eukprot:1425696-Pyramimonas_sp.AAC.1
MDLQNQQFCDRGAQYRSVVFYGSPEEKKAAERSKDMYQASGVFGKGTPLVTEIAPRSTFWPAEEYHQDYYKKNPDRYYVRKNHPRKNNNTHAQVGE